MASQATPTRAVTKQARARSMAQRPCVIWLTGLSAAGKTTIAQALEARLHARGLHTFVLDGDALRTGLNRDLGFTDGDRAENVRRAGEVAKLMVDAGLWVVAAFISPCRAQRRSVRALFAPDEFLEVHIDVPLAVAEQRDPKGLYRKARRGELANFTGVDSAYEAPEHPDLKIDTSRTSVEAAVEHIIALMGARLAPDRR